MGSRVINKKINKKNIKIRPASWCEAIDVLCKRLRLQINIRNGDFFLLLKNPFFFVLIIFDAKTLNQPINQPTTNFEIR